ncbi:MAG: hypothetical protein LBK95_13105 [Bifidobacteriaceae bacterium]|jgi:hypothetical protein|nr:hypothetical protein [Bifidobacteriaceae bacterium]
MIPEPTDSQAARALLRSVAPERLRRFRQAVPGGAQGAALRLYLLDARLAAEFQALFRFAEILLREAVHRALSAYCSTAAWHAAPIFRAGADTRVLQQVDEAAASVARRRGPAPAGDVVARLMLGTWVQLLAPGAGGRQEAGLWNPALAAAFQSDAEPGRTRTRSDVYALAQRLLWARNRTNHCEPVVFGFPLAGQMTASGKHRRLTPLQLLDDVRQLAGFIDSDIGAWLDTWRSSEEMLAGELAGHALAFMDHQPRVLMEGRRPATPDR